MEEGEKEAIDLWTRFRLLSIEKYKETYARLNVHFDVYSGESMFEQPMKDEIKLLESKGLLKESQGAHVVDLQEHGLGTVVVKKKDGTTLYITRDIAAASSRAREYNFDEMYYVVAMQQELHFKQLFKTLELAGYDWAERCHHISFGLVKGMSTRRGDVVFLEEILNEAKRVMHEVMKQNEEKYKQVEDPDKVADIVGKSAVVIQDMSARRIKDYDFNWSRMTSSEGDTGFLLSLLYDLTVPCLLFSPNLCLLFYLQSTLLFSSSRTLPAIRPRPPLLHRAQMWHPVNRKGRSVAADRGCSPQSCSGDQPLFRGAPILSPAAGVLCDRHLHHAVEPCHLPLP